MTEVLVTDREVTVGGLWTYVWADRRHPFVHPLTTPAGHVLTRDAPDDHPWHHGLWFTVKFVDGDNFWEEVPPYGVLRHDTRPEVTAGPDGRVALSGTLRWVRPDRRSVALTEQRCLTHVPLADEQGQGGYAVDLDTTLVPGEAVRLDRTEYTTWGGYGGLTLRGAAELVDTRLLLADGSVHGRVAGIASPWCDLSGTVVAGGAAAPAGLALFDHPANRRFPTPFYASTFDGYGEGGWTNFCNAAFLWADGLDLGAGEALRIRHRAVVHDGLWPVDRLQTEWDAWSSA